jgi:glyoxylase-like metal-dependent hydrolase (beta-lactamase superfamily II)
MRALRITAAIGAAALLAQAFAMPALAQGEPFTATDLPGGLVMIGGPDGNVVAGADAAGLTLVDGGSAENAAALLEFAQAETGADRLATLIVTHWHPDRIGLNEIAGAQGAQIVAHDNTYQYLKYGVESPISGEFAPLPAAALPTVRYYDDGGLLPFGEDEIRIGYLRQAHTDGDIYAYFPGANVLVTGGAVRSDGWNMVDWWTAGYLGGVLDGFGTLLEVANDDTVIVPASGPAMTKAELQAQFDMYTQIYDRLATSLKGALSPAEAVAANPTEGFHPEWADADIFAELAFRSYYSHLRGNPRLGPIP